MKITWALILFITFSVPSFGQNECDKFELVAMYDFPPNPNPGGDHVLVLITVSEAIDARFDPHYTTMYFRSFNGDTVTVPTGRSLSLPTKSSDTIPYVLELTNGRANSDFPKDFNGELVFETPTSPPFPAISICRINFNLTTANVKNNKGSDLVVFPNPFDDVLSFKSNETIDEIWIYDVKGKLIYNSVMSDVHDRIDLSHIGTGTLFAIFKTSSGNYSTKMLSKL